MYTHKSGPVAADERRPRFALSSSDPPRLHLASTLSRLGFVWHISSRLLLSTQLLSSTSRLRSSSPRLLFTSAPLRLGSACFDSSPRLVSFSAPLGRRILRDDCESRCESCSATCAGLAAGQAGPACGTASTDDYDAAATSSVPIIVPIEAIEKVLPRGVPRVRRSVSRRTRPGGHESLGLRSPCGLRKQQAIGRPTGRRPTGDRQARQRGRSRPA